MSTTDDGNSTATKYNLLGAFSKDDKPEDWAVEDYKAKIATLSYYDIHDCAFQAALRGNVRLLRLLFGEKGSIRVDYVNEPPNLTRHHLNGQTYDMNGIRMLERIETVAEFKDLLKAINEFGISGLIEPGTTFPAIFRQIETNSNFKALAAERFSGDLPELSLGKLKSPELAIALKDEAQANPFPAAYSPMLCWASENMVKEFPGSLKRLNPFQEVWGRGSMAYWKTTMGDDSHMLFSKIVTGVRPDDGVKHASLLMKPMCPLAQVYGFEDQEGRVLCETTTDFLLGFELADVSEQNILSAKDFVNGYCPIEIIATQVTEACINEFGHRGSPKMAFINVDYDIFHTGGYTDLFGLLAKDHPLQERAISMMEQAQWKSLLLKSNNEISASSLIAMHQAFGVDNTGLCITVRSEEVDDYLAADFRFSEDTTFFDTLKLFKAHRSANLVSGTTAVLSSFNGYSFMDGDEATTPRENVDRTYQEMVLRINLWPSDAAKPKDLADALRMAGPLDLDNVGNNKAMGLRAILVDAGIKACIEVASTPRSWLKIKEVFSRDELNPYMNQIPRAVRGKLLEQDLGM